MYVLVFIRAQIYICLKNSLEFEERFPQKSLKRLLVGRQLEILWSVILSDTIVTKKNLVFKRSKSKLAIKH